MQDCVRQENNIAKQQLLPVENLLFSRAFQLQTETSVACKMRNLPSAS